MRSSDRGQDKEVVSELEGRVSRSALLSKAGAATVAAVAAGTLLSPRQAKATHGSPGITVEFVSTHRVSANNGPNGNALVARGSSDRGAVVLAKNEGLSPTVDVENPFGGPAVKATVVGATSAVRGNAVEATGTDIGVWAKAETGVWGLGNTGVWDSWDTFGHSGVYGEHTGSSGFGVVGDGKGEGGAGVLGRNQGGTGVHGRSSKTGYGGGTAQHTGSFGYGVIGLGTGATGAGVLGRNNSGGYGGQFEGGKAQLVLKPGGVCNR